MQGNQAMSEGAIYAGARFFAGYPITPSSEIAEECSKVMPKIGGIYMQMEDEIASIAAVIGASLAGAKAFTATSGPGFSLMQENLGLAVMGEVPCVVIDVRDTITGITNQNIFRVGSTTKMFVAALIGRLMEKGLLSYNDTLDKWFPDLPFAKTVTIRELLNHTSGIKENLFTDPVILTESFFSDNKQWDAQEVVYDLMKDMEVKSVDQRSFMYANNNYLLLGLIAEKVGGNKIYIQLENEFFIPLKMKNTYFLPYYKQRPDGLISGFDEYIPLGPHEISPANITWDRLTFSAGAMASTSEDLLIWLDALFHDRVLKHETLAAMRMYINARDNGRDNSIVGYGLGLAQYEINGNKLEGHPGGGFGGECYPFYFPEKDISIVVSYNWSRKDNPAGKIVIKRIIDRIINNSN